MAANTHYQNTGAVDEKLVINLDRDETTRMAAPAGNHAQRSSQAESPARAGNTFILQTNLAVNPLASGIGPSSSSQPAVVELSDEDDTPGETFDEDDYMTDEDVIAWMAQQNRVEVHLATTRTSEQLCHRNSTISNPFKALPTITITTANRAKININPNTNVEFRDGDFMRVKYIIQNTTTKEIKLRGWVFRRTKVMNGLLERKINELCWVLHVDEDDSRPYQVQGMEEANLDDVIRRRAVRLTNRLFPELSWREENVEEEGNIVANERVLVCRYKYMCTYATAKARLSKIWRERALVRLRQDECDRLLGTHNKPCAYDESKLRLDWRGDSPRGGACKKPLDGETRFLQRERKDREASRSQSSSDQLVHRHRSLKRGSVGNLRNAETLGTPIPTASTTADTIYIDPPSPDRGAREQKHRLKYPDRQTSTTAPIIDLVDEDSREAEVELVSTNRRLSISLPSSPQQSVKTVEYTAEQSSRVSTQIKRPRSGTDEAVMQTKVPKRLNEAGNEDTRRSRSPSLIEEKTTSSTLIHRHKVSYSTEKTGTGTGIGTETRSNSHLRQIRIAALPRQSIPQGRNVVTPFLLPQQRYTFGDCFCGAGGTSRGAVMAGLRVEWGFDFALAACKSYLLNFYQSMIYNIAADEFSDLKAYHKVDILHLSPPCQFFSDAHTTEGKDDDMNTASLFAVSELLMKTRPRVVTLEQTSGLARRHPSFLNALINMFTSRGFSIRWRILNLKEYGLPQNRLRLIMIASCPGENLPPFPHPTHSADPVQTGLKPFKTINEAISQIPDGWDHHEPAKCKERNEPPYDGDTQARTMTTSGAGMVHPSGKRSFTHREFAALQGFGLEHKFSDVAVRKQIGNAVPPCVAAILFESIKKALRKADGLGEEET